MEEKTLKILEHSHSFNQEHVKDAERYTIMVICITAFTMFIEIAAGIIFGSMALLADGVHMGTRRSWPILLGLPRRCST